MSAAAPGQAARQALYERLLDAAHRIKRCEGSEVVCASCRHEISDVMEAADAYAQAADAQPQVITTTGSTAQPAYGPGVVQHVTDPDVTPGQASAGQAAYEAFHVSIGLPVTPESCGDWPGMDNFEQAHWETAAAAALAAREPDAADGNCPCCTGLHSDDCNCREDCGVTQCQAADPDYPDVSGGSVPYPPAEQPTLGTAWRLLEELRASVGSIAAGLEQRANVNRPSKVTEICDGIAASLRKLLEGK